jgi:predicted N-formylglutamate amidohydrolase
MTAEKGERSERVIDETCEVVRAGSDAGVLITCEHASQRLPEPWRWSPRDQRLVGTHWAYDLGAAELAREYAEAVGGVAVLARFSRLLADPNRAEDSETLFRAVADGEPVELNAAISPEEREIRLDGYYRPFHDAVDRKVAASRAPILLAMHTFTPLYEGTPRALEIGVLFDREEALAAALIERFARAGWNVAPNEPYSGRAGLIHVVEFHAKTHGRRAIELEVRQDLAVDPAFRARFVAELAAVLR